MNLGLGIKVEQTQKLIMTPELRQAIKILQLSAMELIAYVNQMVAENPLIDVKYEDTATLEKRSDINWEQYMLEMRRTPERKPEREEKTARSLDNVAHTGVSLQEHLLSQLGVISLTKKEVEIARYLIGNLNSAGYITVTLEQVCDDLKVKEQQAEKMLTLIQGFDPPGIGARNLSECLLLQLRQRGLYQPELVDIINSHLENIASGKYNKVAHSLSLPVARVQELADIIKTLNPKPGSSFGKGDEVGYIIPDVLVERVDGEYYIVINDNHIPRLSINKTYSSILNKTSNVDETTRDFVESKLNQAVWLIRSIEQRRMTIYQVTEAIVKMQRDFFEHGAKYLKPLTLKQVAEMVGVHESTVSRATSNKYIQTPHGIFEYKFFFDTGLNTRMGDYASSESIKRTLQEIIKAEDPYKPYSDQKLTDFLRSRGILIARRTVTKYREEMGIPGTGQRKRYKT